MNQANSVEDPKHDSSEATSDANERRIQSASATRPVWMFTNKPALWILFALAAWGTWTLAYQLFVALGDSAMWFLTAVVCVILVFTYKRWRPRYDRILQRISDPEGTRLENKLWRTAKVTLQTFLGVVLAIVALRGMNESHRQQHNWQHVPPTVANRPMQSVERRQTTAAYWQTTISALHDVRFNLPAADEPANKSLERAFQVLERGVIRAKTMSTTGVDRDLVAMTQKHLATDDRMIQLKKRFDELMKREGILTEGDTIGDRATEWQNIVAMAQANPELIDKLPEEGRRLFQDAIELEQKRLDQLREIEIMQAVLQERYRGTVFPLPVIAQ